MNFNNKIIHAPLLPEFLSAPFKLMPVKLHSRFLAVFLNRLLSQQLADGELDFLKHRRLCIKVDDARVSYNLSLSAQGFAAVSVGESMDLSIKASIYDFLLLAARQEDPDTLMFQRRLVMQGDTELGLELKNFLDGLDIQSSRSFAVIESLLQKTLPVYRRLFS